jgi:predicted DNA-binding protein (MmcQ/YjbR family)
MDVENFRDICLDLPGTSESFPFDDVTLVFKVQGKMFALVSLDTGNSANLKCDPGQALEYRSQFMAVQPGYHMNKTHWNTVQFNEDVSDDMLRQMILDSYRLVVAKLPLKVRQQIPGYARG